MILVSEDEQCHLRRALDGVVEESDALAAEVTCPAHAEVLALVHVRSFKRLQYDELREIGSIEERTNQNRSRVGAKEAEQTGESEMGATSGQAHSNLTNEAHWA